MAVLPLCPMHLGRRIPEPLPLPPVGVFSHPAAHPLPTGKAAAHALFISLVRLSNANRVVLVLGR